MLRMRRGLFVLNITFYLSQFGVYFLIIKIFVSVMKINAFVGVLNFFGISQYTNRFLDDWKMHKSY